MSAPRVDLVVNCYERTFREVLAPGTFARIVADNRFAFACRTLLVNNVADREAVRTLADQRIAEGELDRVVFAQDHLDDALRKTGLTRPELEPVPWFTDWALVAICLDGPEWILHWDAEVQLLEPADWITDAVALAERDERVLVANPAWDGPMLSRETFASDGPFRLGHGFSDQVWLARRADLARPIYRTRSLARLRYPMAHVGRIFEDRIDSYIRTSGKLRATHTGAVWRHPPNMGVAYADKTLLQKARHARNVALIAAVRRSPIKPFSLRYL
jgi:hypothetical protein